MQNILKENNKNYKVNFMATHKKEIKTLGGITIIPNCTLDEVDKKDISCLLLIFSKSIAENKNY